MSQIREMVLVTIKDGKVIYGEERTIRDEEPGNISLYSRLKAEWYENHVDLITRLARGEVKPPERVRFIHREKLIKESYVRN